MSAYAYSLLAALVWGISPILEKYGISNTDPALGVAIRSIGVFFGAMILFWALPGSFSWQQINGASALCFAAAGVISSVLGQVFAYNAFKRADVSQVSPLMGAWPLLVVLFGWLFLKEPMTGRKILGAATIVLGAWLLRF